jgi:FkbM family methyltransferase
LDAWIATAASKNTGANFSDHSDHLNSGHFGKTSSMSDSIINSLFIGLRKSLESRSASPLFADGRPVFIYGAGNIGKDVFRLLTGCGIFVAGFLDRGARLGSAWNGVPILAPDDPSLPATQRQQAHVVIAIFNPHVEMLPVITTLKTLGYGRVTSFLDLHDCYPAELGNRYWLTDRAYYLALEQPISKACELWSDAESRRLYADALRLRFTKDYQCLSAPTLHDTYFPEGLTSWPTPVRFLDCGAFDGDTLKKFLDLKIPLEAIAAFEPDPANFDKLAQYIRAEKSSLPPNIALYPCGVAASTGQVRFSAGQGTGSHVSATGDAMIQCVALDEVLPAFRPNFIKMDIEGAEYEALWGARRLIAEHRPSLAISLYHHPNHLWQIPLLVHQLTGGGGKYFLRLHQHGGFDLVLYWLPD